MLSSNLTLYGIPKYKIDQSKAAIAIVGSLKVRMGRRGGLRGICLPYTSFIAVPHPAEQCIKFINYTSDFCGPSA